MVHMMAILIIQIYLGGIYITLVLFSFCFFFFGLKFSDFAFSINTSFGTTTSLIFLWNKNDREAKLHNLLANNICHPSDP